MDKKETIALCLGDNDGLCDIFRTTTVVIKGWTDDQWNTLHRCDIAMNSPTSIGEMKGAAMGLVKALGDCRILVAKKFTGVCYQVLSAQDLYLFELEKEADTILSQCLEEVHSLQRREATPKAPVATDLAGVFALDFIALQEKYPEISTKMALKSFLQEKAFQELWLKCKHLPPWLEGEAVTVRQMEENEFLITPCC